MTDKQRRFQRAARYLRAAHDSLGSLEIDDMSMGDVQSVKELQDDMIAWKYNLEGWAEDERENEDTTDE